MVDGVVYDNGDDGDDGDDDDDDDDDLMMTTTMMTMIMMVVLLLSNVRLPPPPPPPPPPYFPAYCTYQVVYTCSLTTCSYHGPAVDAPPTRKKVRVTGCVRFGPSHPTDALERRSSWVILRLRIMVLLFSH